MTDQATKPIAGGRPSDAERDWLKYWRQLRRDSPKALDDAAKQVMLLSTGASTLYVSILTGLKVAAQIVDLGARDQALLLAPVILWLAGSGSALMALLPRRYGALADAPETIEDAWGQLTKWKYKWLVGAVIPLAIGVLVAAIGAVLLISQSPADMAMPAA